MVRFLLAAAVAVVCSWYAPNFGSPLAVVLVALAMILTLVGLFIILIARYSTNPDDKVEPGPAFPVIPMPPLPTPGQDDAVTLMIEFTPSRADIAEARLTANEYLSQKMRPAHEPRGPSPRAKPSRPLAGVVAFFALIVMAVLLVSQSGHHPRVQSSMHHADPARRILVDLAFALGGAGTIAFAIGLMLLKHVIRPSPTPVRVRLSSEAVVITQSGIQDTLSWRCFEAMTETPNLIVLHQSNKVCRFFPKAAFGNLEQLNDLYRIVRRNLPQLAEQAERP